MKNYLIITIGTRDVQTTEKLIQESVDQGHLAIESRFLNQATGKESISSIRLLSTGEIIKIKANNNEQFSNFYIFSSPREAGQYLVQAPTDTTNWLTFPLVKAPLNWLQQKIGFIDYVLTVFTDQDKPVAGFHWKDDTLFFNKLIQKFLQNHPVTEKAFYEDYPITQQPVNIDYQYDHFEQAKGGLLHTNIDEVENIYLLAQGGIDQINTALTLKLLEHFPGKVRYLQQPEDHSVEERKFPRKFLRNINKVKAAELLNRFDFNAIQAIIHDKKPLLLSRVGDLLRNLHVEDARQCYNQLLKSKYSNSGLDTFWQLVNDIGEYQARQRLLFLNALVEYKQEQYNEVVLRLRTLGEVLLGPNIAEYIAEQDIASRKKFDKAVLLINGLSKHLEIILNMKRPEYGWLADAKTLRAIYDYRYLSNVEEKPVTLTNLSDCIDSLRDLRNKLIHSAQPVTRQDLENSLKSANTSIDQLLEDIRAYFQNITGFGIYDTIREEIKALL